MVYVSSIAALGDGTTSSIIDENTPWDNNIDKTPYSYSKYGGEVEVWRGMQEGLNAVIFNPGIILGKGSPVEKVLQPDKKGIRWYTPGTKAFVGIDDVVDVMEKLMNNNISGERFILVSENWTGKAVAQYLAKTSKKKSKIASIPKLLLYLIWGFEHLIQLLGIRKRFLTRATILSQYEQKTLDGSKIKSYIDFEYTSIKEQLLT